MGWRKGAVTTTENAVSCKIKVPCVRRVRARPELQCEKHINLMNFEFRRQTLDPQWPSECDQNVERTITRTTRNPSAVMTNAVGRRTKNARTATAAASRLLTSQGRGVIKKHERIPRWQRGRMAGRTRPTHGFIMMRAFSQGQQWRRRCVPMTDRPNVAHKLRTCPAACAFCDEVQCRRGDEGVC
jgi:hypothetical protein